MSHVHFGINLGFAVKRWPEPEAWAELVAERLGLKLVQFTFDLLDPWWPEAERRLLAHKAQRAAAAAGLTIHSAFVGLASYTYNGLLHPEPAGRRAALEWWRRAVDLAAELGASAVGGPLGGMSVASAPNQRERLYPLLLDDVRAITEWAAAAGLREMLIEPTPLTREIPHHIDEARRLLADLDGTTAVPVRYVIDVGHALYRPLYGSDAALEPWLNALGHRIGVFHLQNTDFQSDSHWGWPDPRGHFDVPAFARAVQAAGLGETPTFLEVFYSFEMDDQAVLDNITQSVEHCRRALATSDAG
ncbi:MAG: TIM barrel protein [Anaerolineae bacterium]|nr:sugar phosphate isomerase/epimerase [Thermoflexales bacterium]MDW8408643.1 TIM barrel protein [Anaerolineae bacterium]